LSENLNQQVGELAWGIKNLEYHLPARLELGGFDLPFQMITTEFDFIERQHREMVRVTFDLFLEGEALWLVNNQSFRDLLLSVFENISNQGSAFDYASITEIRRILSTELGVIKEF
jgi:hypothetical protein